MNEVIAEDFDPFASGELSLTAPTTESQQEIWLAVELGGRSANLAYNECVSLKLEGPLDEAALHLAMQDVVARHDALRSTFSRDGTTLCVEATARLGWTREDFSEMPAELRESLRTVALRNEANVPFDLARGPLIRTRLMRLSPGYAELVITAHHIVCDGWSMAVLVGELAAAYASRLQQVPYAAEPAPQFSDYAVEERNVSNSLEAVEAERYWLKALGNTPSTLDLPTDEIRPAERAFEATRQDWLIEPELLEEIRATGKKAGASLVATLLAAFDAFLFRITGQTDFVVAMPAAGQAAVGQHRLVGHCVNTLPIRAILDPAAPFLEHVRFVKRAILDAAEQQRLSFGGLLRKLELPRDAARIPLVPVLFNVDPRVSPPAFGNLRATFVSNPRAFDSFEIFLNASEKDCGLVLELTYSTRLFSQETILRWLEEFTVLLRGVAQNPGIALGRLPVLSDQERRRILVEWNDTALRLPAENTAIALIEAQARRTPDAIAVRDHQGALTYRQLDRRANHLAHQLQKAGVGAQDRVGIAVERSCRMLVALLAVWKAGAAYVPLDPEYPKARLDFIASDAALSVLVTEHSLADVLSVGPGIARVWLDEENGERPDAPARRDGASDLAYVLHTSGSTGTPKGVQIEHGALVNFLVAMSKQPGILAQDVLVAVTTLSFDIAGLELFLPLTVGAQVVVAERDVAVDGARLSALLVSSGATLFQATPATWRLLVESGWAGGKTIKGLCGGEALPKELAAELLARIGSLWNVYGPTETTIWSTCAEVTEVEGRISIGKPIANTTTYVLDDRMEPVPTGSVGELYIGGLGVARGYLNRPELNQERFVRNPFSSDPNSRLYRTGDCVRYDGSGRLFFERRNDGQVKVRGFRIELGEIESGLEQHPAVRQACVVVREFGSGDVRLVAYVVAHTGQTLNPAVLREQLVARVPGYMVPQHFVLLPAMPLTPNGKVDRKALPNPSDESAAGDQYAAPTTRVQMQLAQIWADLLRVHRVGLHDGFFELGGHSMVAARMLARVRDLLGVELPLRTAFQAQTIDAFSAHVEAALLVQRPGASSFGAGLLQTSSAGPVQEIDF